MYDKPISDITYELLDDYKMYELLSMTITNEH